MIGDVWGNSWGNAWGSSWKGASTPPIVVTPDTWGVSWGGTWGDSWRRSAVVVTGIPQGGGGGRKKKKHRVIKYSDFADQEEREIAFRAAITVVPVPISFDAYDEDDDEILLMTLARLFH